MNLATRTRLLGAIVLLQGAMLLSVTTAAAQSFGPPQTIFGSITDSAGTVPDKLPVQALINGKVCGEGTTEFVGEGSSRVTVYAVDVVERGQRADCGSDGAEVRIKIGDRIADQKALWRAGPQRVDILFGGAATPAPIPTFTPTQPATATSASNTPVPGQTPQPIATGDATSGSTSATPGSSAVGTLPVSQTISSADATATATLRGGLATNEANGGGGNDGDGGGLPVWGIAALVLGVVGVAGGGVGIMMARARARDRDSITNPG